MTARHLVIVGASLAGLRAAETLRQHGFTGRLTVVGGETHPPYDRPPLSKQLLTSDTPVEVALPVPGD
ncbi:FAD-dependent oxidoreductase, partial [Saccharomonospora xinjiangensis]